MFKKRNEAFTCINCNKDVNLHPSSSRDHCNFCLYGQHVDNEPGDRANDCKGILEPIGMRKKQGKEQIVYRCQKCKAIVYCVFAPDDNFEVKIELTLVEF
jgi:hypothetical protein